MDDFKNIRRADKVIRIAGKLVLAAGITAAIVGIEQIGSDNDADVQTVSGSSSLDLNEITDQVLAFEEQKFIDEANTAGIYGYDTDRIAYGYAACHMMDLGYHPAVIASPGQLGDPKKLPEYMEWEQMPALVQVASQTLCDWNKDAAIQPTFK